jgi:UDP-GlcNAc3NAcA epimerase
MKILTVVGARPQFVKAAIVSKTLRKQAHEVLIHTGQHYDLNMSDLFFKELEIPTPDYNLGIGSGNHGAQTGKMLEAIEKVILKEQPDVMLIYGDTNSTLAGALAAAKLYIPIAHVEAGLRSFNRKMPEEINRVMADHISTWLFAPTKTAVKNLKNEGINQGVHLVGDVMYDIFLAMAKIAPSKSTILNTLGLKPRAFSLLTLHRAENTDNPKRISLIINTLNNLKQTIIFPIHPRTKAKLLENNIMVNPEFIKLIEPIGYFDMLNLELNSSIIFTDSGGVQKEAYMAKTPCITLRDETEWVETVDVNQNKLVGADPDAIQDAIKLNWVGNVYPEIFGDGRAAEKISAIITN